MTNPYLPRPYKILNIVAETDIDYTFTFEYESGASAAGGLVGGQFMEISVPGAGEAPISICNFGPGFLEMTIRKVGRLTDVLFRLKPDDVVYMRGPYGNGFNLDQLKGKDLTFIAGGTGLAPIRKTIDYFCNNRHESKGIHIIAGFKSPSDRLFIRDLEAWSQVAKVTVTVDKPHEDWTGPVGLITQHLTLLDLDHVEEKIAVVVGPPIMMKFTTLELIKLGFKPENIVVSFERKMSCGIGKCGHCKIDETYVCLEGPVFSYVKAMQLLD